LNRSDTPVSEAVLREMLPQMMNLNSQKAQTSLGLGLNLGQMNEGRREFNINALLAGAGGMPSALGGLANRFQNERFANASYWGNQTSSPGLMDQIGTGLGLAQQGVKLAGSVGSMFGAPSA
jgi:hypothetical protein